MKNNEVFNIILNLEEINRFQSHSDSKEKEFRKKLDSLELPLQEKEKVKAAFEEMIICVKEEYFTIGISSTKKD